MASAPTTLVSWVRAPAASATGVRGAAAADREALKKAGCQVGGAEPDHLLVGIDLGAQSCRIGPRQHAGVGERDQGDGAAADQHRDDIVVRDPGDCETRQALRKRTQNRYAVTRRDPALRRGRRADDGNQNARQPLVVLEQQNDDQRAEPNREMRPSLSFRLGWPRRSPTGSATVLRSRSRSRTALAAG